MCLSMKGILASQNEQEVRTVVSVETGNAHGMLRERGERPLAQLFAPRQRPP